MMLDKREIRKTEDKTEDKTIRKMLSGFVYEKLDEIAELIDRDRENAVYAGYPALEDDSNMILGLVVESLIRLAVHYGKTGDLRYETNLKRISSFSGLFTGKKLDTWGKLTLLRGLCLLYDEGKLHLLTEEALAIYRDKTEYSDFLDKECLTLKGGKPTNYYHVAMACAGYREKLGWENDGMSDKLMNKMLSVMGGSSGGWADEQIPYGRFDAYSVNAPSESAGPLAAVGKKVPDAILQNLRQAAVLCLHLSNACGDGFPYGRSLAIHGDLTPCDVLFDAMEFGLLTEEEREQAAAYITKVIEKLTGFWYDEELGAFNIWLKGRATNGYRNISRILEVSLNALIKMTRYLELAEKFGFADRAYSEKDFEENASWKCIETIFDQKEDSVRALYLLMWCGKQFALPLINAGTLALHASYLPFPVCLRLTEAPPESKIPFLVPRYTLKDSRIAIPAGFYQDISVMYGTDSVCISARGLLSCFADENAAPTAGGSFRTDYTFAGDKIQVAFSVDLPIESVRMVYAGSCKISAFGFDWAKEIEDISSPVYHTAHGAPASGMEWIGSNTDVSYEISLQA